jgi:predicted dehydrogenase
MTSRPPGTTRRRFLAGLARAAGAGLAWPAVARARAVETASTPSAQDQVRVGFIGVGGMGSGHLGAYAGDRRYPAVAVCDVDPAHREAAARRVSPEGGQHSDYRELLDRKDVDAVVIAVPDHWHALIAVHACEAGKDVYCEKPLSLTIAQARAMVTAARRYGRVFQTGSQQRSSGEFLKACELVRNGRLGKVHTVLVNVWGTSRPCYLPAEEPPPGMDWDRWIGPAPWRPFAKALHPFNWRDFRDFSGGMMTDWGAHHLDIAQWGLGMDHTGPVEIEPPQGGEQYVTYRYESGAIVKCGQTGVNGVQFIGPRGKITVNRGYFHAEPEEAGEEPLGAGAVRLYHSPGHHEDWRRCLWTRERPITDVEIGARSVTVCHLGNIAIWLGRKIRWDPVKEQIVDDAEAHRWTDRPLRAPYHL